MRLSKWGVIPAGAYLALYGAAFAYVAYRLFFQPANSELVGLLLIALTLPWSTPALSGLEALGFRFESVPVNLAIMALMALPNALVLYALGALAGRRAEKLRAGPSEKAGAQ